MAGIIPRSLHQLFEELESHNIQEYSVRVSFLELYNEELFDLLSTTEDNSKLRIFEDSTRKVNFLPYSAYILRDLSFAEYYLQACR